MTETDILEMKKTALAIAAMLPADRQAALSIMGMVEDLLDWRDGAPDREEEEAA